MRWRTFRGFVLNECKNRLVIKTGFSLDCVLVFTQSSSTHSLLVARVGEKLVPVPEVRVLFVPADVPPVADESLGRQLSIDLSTCIGWENLKFKNSTLLYNRTFRNLTKLEKLPCSVEGWVSGRARRNSVKEEEEEKEKNQMLHVSKVKQKTLR